MSQPSSFQRFMNEYHMLVFGFGIPLGFLLLAFLAGPPPKRPKPPPTEVTLSPADRQLLVDAIVATMQAKDAGRE